MSVGRNSNVRATPECLLWTTSYAALLGNRINTPTVSCIVVPLKYTLSASNSLRQLQSVEKYFEAFAHCLSCFSTVNKCQQMLVKALLSFVLLGVVIFTKSELNPTLVIGSDSNLNINHLSLSVIGNNGSCSILPRRFIFPHSIPPVTTNTTLAFVFAVPLSPETSTVFCVVRIIFGCVETKSPCCSSCRWMQ